MRVTQLVAFHEEDQPPTKEMLQAVRCHDISLGGISFFLSGPPPLKHCTVVLGRPPTPDLREGPGSALRRRRGPRLREWKIGCQFIEKVESTPAQGKIRSRRIK